MDSQSRSKKNSDPGWKYNKYVNANDKSKGIACNFCGTISNGGIFRAKNHQTGDDTQVRSCLLCPQGVKDELRKYAEEKRKLKESSASNLMDDIVESRADDDVELIDDIEMYGVRRSLGKRRATESSSQPKSSNSVKGPLDLLFSKKKVEQKKGEQQTHTACVKELRDQAAQKIARWMYDAGIPFNAVKYDSFAAAFQAVMRCGLEGFKPPSYHEVRVPLLKKEVEHTRELIQPNKDEWKTIGCSLMVDGWRDRKDRALLNFLANSPKGSVFLYSKDASSYSKTGEKMLQLWEEAINLIGKENVIQVVTDNASENAFAGN